MLPLGWLAAACQHHGVGHGLKGKGGCAGDGIITIYERAMAQVWLHLEAIAQQHASADALQALVQVSCAPQLP